MHGYLATAAGYLFFVAIRVSEDGLKFRGCQRAQNRPGFVQSDTPKIENRFLSPESYRIEKVFGSA